MIFLDLLFIGEAGATEIGKPYIQYYIPVLYVPGTVTVQYCTVGTHMRRRGVWSRWWCCRPSSWRCTGSGPRHPAPRSVSCRSAPRSSRTGSHRPSATGTGVAGTLGHTQGVNTVLRNRYLHREIHSCAAVSLNIKFNTVLVKLQTVFRNRIDPNFCPDQDPDFKYPDPDPFVLFALIYWKSTNTNWYQSLIIKYRYRTQYPQLTCYV